MGGCGVSYTAAIAFGGKPADPSFTALTETWNGTAWTEVADLNSARGNLNGSGSTTSALAYLGSNPGTSNKTLTESWDGTSWTEVADLTNTRRAAGAAGGSDNTSALAAGGYTTTNVANTEEWTITATPTSFTKQNLGQVYYNSGSNAFKVTEQPVPGGTWASGGAMNTARNYVAGDGIQTAAIASVCNFGLVLPPEAIAAVCIPSPAT